jgi:hypothetical protein
MADDRLQGHDLGKHYEMCCLDACKDKPAKKDIPKGQGKSGSAATKYWTCEDADDERRSCGGLSRKPGGSAAARGDDCKCMPFKLKKKDRKKSDRWEPLEGDYPEVTKEDDDYDFECFCVIKV